MGKQMTEQKLRGVLRQAYYWGRDNGTNRSENNFNDFLETETGKKALNIADVGSYVPEDIQDFLHKLRFAHRTRIREEASDLLKKYS